MINGISPDQSSEATLSLNPVIEMARPLLEKAENGDGWH